MVAIGHQRLQRDCLYDAIGPLLSCFNLLYMQILESALLQLHDIMNECFLLGKETRKCR